MASLCIVLLLSGALSGYAVARPDVTAAIPRPLPLLPLLPLLLLPLLLPLPPPFSILLYLRLLHLSPPILVASVRPLL